MTDYNEFNRGVIAEFREKQGRVASFGEAPMILITHKGAKSGKEYVTPLVCSREGDSYVIIASMGGAPTDPQWFRNLRAAPQIQVQVLDRRFAATAHEYVGAERDAVWTDVITARVPGVRRYAAKAGRTIPVALLRPVP